MAYLELSHKQVKDIVKNHMEEMGDIQQMNDLLKQVIDGARKWDCYNIDWEMVEKIAKQRIKQRGSN
jgi:predicted DNA-binding protein